LPLGWLTGVSFAVFRLLTLVIRFLVLLIAVHLHPSDQMKFIGFSLGGQNIDLEWPGGGYADLHNNFDFTGLHFEPSQARLRLSWQKSTGEWAKQEPWAELHLLFEGVSLLRLKERDPEYPLTA
jgi:hypothetical protein